MDTSFDAAQTQPPFGPGELERWFASFDSFTAKKGHHSALSLFAVRFGNKGFPKFSDPEWLGLVRARQAGIQAEASLKETPARSRAIRRQHTKVAREGELAAELIAAGVVCLIVKESRLIAEQAYKTAAGQHLDDLIQEGLEGLEETVQRFDTNSDRKFFVYFLKALRAKLRSYVDKNTTDIDGLPSSWARVRRIAIAGRARLETEMGRLPTIEELQEECRAFCFERTMEREAEKTPGLKKAELKDRAHKQLLKQGTLGAINKLQELLEVTHVFSRLDETVGEGGTSRGDLVVDGRTDNVGAAVETFDMIAAVRDALTTLDDRQQYVLSARYGFLDGEEWTYADIAEKLEISAERVRQIANAALSKLSLPGATATVLAGHLDFDAPLEDETPSV